MKKMWWLTLLPLVLVACSSGGAGVGDVSGAAADEELVLAEDLAPTLAPPTAVLTDEDLLPTSVPPAVEPVGEESAEIESQEVDDRPDWLKSRTQDWNTNWDKHSIDYDEILAGGPPRDGIPSVDQPVFIQREDASQWLADNEPVIALEIAGEARAYPLQILTWHEIVNDSVGGLVSKPKTFDLDDLSKFVQDERIYRMRCVEAWSMVIPWWGFPLSRLLEQVEPKSEAKYLRFETLFDPSQMPGQKSPFSPLPRAVRLLSELVSEGQDYLLTATCG